MSDDGKRVTINVRCTAAEKVAAEARASREGYADVSKLVRSLLRNEKGGPSLTAADRQQMKDLSVQLRLAGNLLNQMVRRANLVAEGYDAIKPTLAEAEGLNARFRELEDQLRGLIGEARGRGGRRR